MIKIWEKIKYEFSLLGDVVKTLLTVLFYILIFCIIYKISLPFVKHHLPENITEEDYENISGFVIIGIIWISFIINKLIIFLFKDDTK